MLRSPEPGLGSPEGCKRVAGGRRDHRKEIPLILGTLKGCKTLDFLDRKSWHPFRVPTNQIPFSGGLRPPATISQPFGLASCQ